MKEKLKKKEKENAIETERLPKVNKGTGTRWEDKIGAF